MPQSVPLLTRHRDDLSQFAGPSLSRSARTAMHYRHSRNLTRRTAKVHNLQAVFSVWVYRVPIVKTGVCVDELAILLQAGQHSDRAIRSRQ